MAAKSSRDAWCPAVRGRVGMFFSFFGMTACYRHFRMMTAVLSSGILLLASAGPAAQAQSYPSAPVKLVVTTGAGGAPDVIARIVAEALLRRWGQQVFVANHPGAAGSIGMKVAGTAPADGYTLLFALSSSFVALPEIAKDYPYDLVRDFVSIGFVCEQPMASAVPPSLGVGSLGELIDYTRKHPGQVNVAVLSRGGIPHLTAEWIKRAAGLEWTAVNYPGAPAGLSDVMGGRVQVIMDGLPSLAGSINGGQLELLAVGSTKRLSNRPETPTIAETLPAIPRALGFFALMGPPGMPEPIARRVSDDLRAVLAEPAMIKRFEDIASYIDPMSPAELLSYVRTEQALWKPVIEQISTLKAAPR
ncbi:MAG: tripartite tricarboxylate transporter substrate binding protein [Hyphomicrobiales bacterium]|nr:tripartite tricarboxylate transporter substrate binding protein [Hyphomicrobiales bacterium]